MLYAIGYFIGSSMWPWNLSPQSAGFLWGIMLLAARFEIQKRFSIGLKRKKDKFEFKIGKSHLPSTQNLTM